MSKPTDFADMSDAERAAGVDDPVPMAPPPGPGGAQMLAELYGPEQLERDRNRKLLSVANLPGPRNQNWGWGETLNRALGGGLNPGYILAVGAARAGVGKTAFVMQLADALALRTARILADGGDKSAPLTPVCLLTEMGVGPLTWRTLARWTDRDSRIFRSGGDATSAVPGLSQADADQAFAAGAEALRGELGQSRRHMWLTPGSVSGLAALAAVSANVNAIRDQLEHTGREIWPVVVVDPIQRWQDASKSEVEALNELSEGLIQKAQADGWIVIATSDTNAQSARGSDDQGESDSKDPQRAARMFRGSYKLIHAADAALVVERSENGTALTATASLFKNRWGPALPDPKAACEFDWNPTRALYTPFTPAPLDGPRGRR